MRGSPTGNGLACAFATLLWLGFFGLLNWPLALTLPVVWVAVFWLAMWGRIDADDTRDL